MASLSSLQAARPHLPLAQPVVRPRDELEPPDGEEREPEGLDLKVEAAARDSDAARPLPRRTILILLAASFLGGLVLGWLVVGWWLLPPARGEAPWNLEAGYRRTYVQLVADNFGRTGDIGQAEKALAGWDRQDLAQLLGALQTQAPTPVQRQNAAALASALKLATSARSLLETLFEQPIFYLALLMSLAPLAAAVGLMAFPALRPASRRAVDLSAAGEGFEPGELVVTPEGTFVVAPDGSLVTEAQAQAAGYPIKPLLEGKGKEEGGPATAGGSKEQAKDSTDGKQDGKPTEADKVLDKMKEEAQKQEEATEEEEKDSGMADLMALFQEEDTSLATLEALCKPLPDLKIDDLLKSVLETSAKLKQYSGVGVSRG